VQSQKRRAPVDWHAPALNPGRSLSRHDEVYP
jgi:hypothetical protein